ncbi:MAG: transposase family protein [Solidesulfovibrio magneticus str. Maddingley MBC34]|uniref:Transposase family protein n=1 Tax=Solidesulfovibrio magneticus str. Maddingley MBC34 TaxID=1206767 RepID=K6H8B7_9BACT|nr:MAG: transposase family protein [Solidesulfovibrio magneticus str. Maddingley MBC34]
MSPKRPTAGDERLEGYSQQFTAQQLERIRAVVMDMWEPYFKAMIKHVPDAAHKIVHNLFHIMQHVGQAVAKAWAMKECRLPTQAAKRHSSGNGLSGTPLLFRPSGL